MKNCSLFLLILAFLSSVTLAANVDQDSETIGPQTVNPIHTDSYVLESGSTGNFNLSGSVYSSKECDPGFSPQLQISPKQTYSNGSCAINLINTSSSCYAGSYITCNYSSYASYSTALCPNDKGIQIYYTLWCVKQ